MAKTKKELGNALKKLTHEKPFDRISVSDITSKCNLNRQTFYYHFQDKYECLEWIYRNECLNPLLSTMDFVNWDRTIEQMLIEMAQDKEFYMRTIYASPRTFIDLFYDTTKCFFRDLINAMDEENSFEDGDEDFYSEFFTMGIMGMIMNWVTKGMTVSPLEISHRVKKMANNMRDLHEMKKKFGNKQ